MARQSFASVDFADFPPAAFSAVANTTSETNLWTPSLWTPIPAGDSRAGKIYRMIAGGTLSTTGTPTIIFRPRYGQSGTPASNVNLGASATYTPATAALSSVGWWADFIFGFRAIGTGASGASGIGNGLVVIGNAEANGRGSALAIGGTAGASLDQTTAQGLILSVQWGTASASNTITCDWAALQTLN